MPLPTSFWSGTVSASVSIDGVLQSSFQGKLQFAIYLGPPLQNQQLPISAIFPAETNKIGGSMQGTFSGTVTGTDQSSQGSGTVDLFVGGTYDPTAHKVSLSTAVMGMQATGTHTNGSQTSSVSINVGGQPPVGTIPTAAPPPISPGSTDSDPNNYVFDCAPGAPNPSEPITLDLQQTGSQTLVLTYQDTVDLGLRTTTWNITLDPRDIDVEITPTSIDPTTDGPQATLTVTVTTKGSPATMETINLQICTYIGGQQDDDTHAPDGHLHDQRTVMCDYSSRPTGQLLDTNGQAGPAGATYGSDKFPLMAVTDMTGKVTITYIPPKGGSKYISGKEQITASIVTAPNIKDQTDIITQVPDLEAAPGSADGSGGGTYYFVEQHGAQGHGYLFWGTEATNDALIQIANAFNAAQIACQNGASAATVLSAGYPQNGYNTDPQTNGPRTFTTPGEPKQLRITAMSLPWGGLLDIECGWNPGHYSHNTGKVADFSWADFQVQGATPAPAWNMDWVYLLGAVILSTPNASMPVNWEGGVLGTTLQHFSGQPVTSGSGTSIAAGTPSNAHFHVEFAA
jgi:hypothetical protein